MSSPGDRPAERLADRILVTEPVAEEGLAALRTAAQVDVRRDLSTDALAAVIGDYDGLIVRSGTRVNADVIAAADRLRVIGRAGQGSTTSTSTQPRSAAFSYSTFPGATPSPPPNWRWGCCWRSADIWRQRTRVCGAGPGSLSQK